MDASLRELERAWAARPDDQDALARLIGARRRANLPVSGELLEAVRLPARTLPAFSVLEVTAETDRGARRIKSGGKAPSHALLWGASPHLVPGNRPRARGDVTLAEHIGEVQRRHDARRVRELLAWALDEAAPVGLTGLRLAGSDVADGDLAEVVRRLPELLALDVSFCLVLTTDALRAVEGLPRLQRLDLTFDRQLVRGLAPLRALPALFELKLELAEGLDGRPEPDGARLGPAEAGALPSSLRRLDLRHAARPDALAPLAALPAVEELDVHGSGATAEQLAPLAAASRLRALAVGRSGLTDAGLERLAAGLPRLERLNIERCDEVGDVGLQALARSRVPLRELDLSFCRGLTGEGIAALAAVATLEKVTLDGGQRLRASWRDGRAALGAALPGCVLLPKRG